MAEFEVYPTDGDVAFFAENGFLVVERLTTDDELAHLTEIVEKAMSSGRAFEPGREGDDVGPSQLDQLIAPEIEFPELLDTIYRRNGMRFASALLGVPESELVTWSHMIRKPARRSRIAPWHQDEAYWLPELDYHAVGAWLPLHDVSVERGAMQFIPGSHKGPLLAHSHLGDPIGNLLVVDDVDTSAAVAAAGVPDGVPGPAAIADRAAKHTVGRRVPRRHRSVGHAAHVHRRRRAHRRHLRPGLRDLRR